MTASDRVGAFLERWGQMLGHDPDLILELDGGAHSLRVSDLRALLTPPEIGILGADNGEFTAYCAYFAEPARLREAVARLNAERMDTEAGELVEAEVHVAKVQRIEAIDDDLLDRLASWLEDAGVYVESAQQRCDRLAEEAAEARDGDYEPPTPCPGQMALDEAQP